MKGHVCRPTLGSSRPITDLPPVHNPLALPDLSEFEATAPDPMLELVWVLYSPSSGHMTSRGRLERFIHVFRNEAMAAAWLTTFGNWDGSLTPDTRPLRVSFSTVLGQVQSQRTSSYGIPIVGYTWLPEDNRIRVEAQP